jgi:hypothetical protein
MSESVCLGFLAILNEARHRHDDAVPRDEWLSMSTEAVADILVPMIEAWKSSSQQLGIRGGLCENCC